MKLLSISFILLFIHTNYFLYAAAQQPVLDTDGDEVKPGIEYYLNFPRGFRGGLGLPFFSRLVCPAPVIEMPSGEHRGLPVTFQPVDPTEGTIRESSTELYISFSGTVTGCRDHAGVWRVEYNESVARFFVMAGSPVANPLSHFRLVTEPFFDGYGVEICPPIGGFRCLYIGPYQQRNIIRLAVNDQAHLGPYPFEIFKKQSAGIKLPKL